jgi:hypothetical protein
VNELVWYAAYGSNLSRDRFACYLQGGTPAGAHRSYPGCRDRTPPRDMVALRLPGRLSFGGVSLVWGGGLAYLDPTAPGEVVARGYLVTTQQLDEVFELERRYDVRLTMADLDGTPVVAFASSAAHSPAAPGEPYLRTILAGLTDGLLDEDDAVAYLLSLPGVSLGWTPGAIRALADGRSQTGTTPPASHDTACR